jgi:hypothetical protein
MKEAKSTMWRLTPAMVDAVDALLAEVQADPEMVTQIGDSTGHVPRAALVRLCLSRGMASVRGALRARGTEESKPTPKPARKPAKKAAKRRR